MPQFTTTSVEEAQRITGGGKRQKDLAAYIESVNGLSPGSAGRVIPSEGETLSTVSAGWRRGTQLGQRNRDQAHGRRHLFLAKRASTTRPPESSPDLVRPPLEAGPK